MKFSIPDELDAILFDLDGTLIDSAPALAAAANKMRAARGMGEIPLAAYRSSAGAGARGMLLVAFGIDASHPDWERLKEEFFQSYEADMLDASPAFDGVHGLIDSISAMGLKWGVVTNKLARFTNPITSSMPLFASAQAVVSGDSTMYSKPHPVPLLEAARRLGVAPHRCLYVGDDCRDMVAGRAAGMKTVAALYGYLGADTDISAWPADFTIFSPAALLNLLEKA